MTFGYGCAFRKGCKVVSLATSVARLMDGQCLERRNTPKRRGIRNASAPSAAAAAFTVILRSNAATTLKLAPCSRDYVSLLQRELRGLAELHLLTDLSLWAPQLPRLALRAYADEHEARLARELQGVRPFAFTVADIVTSWPAVKWPLPGDPDFHAAEEYDQSSQDWLKYVHRALAAQGNLTRLLQPKRGHGAGRAVSNLISYYIHEPSLCLWARRERSRGGAVPLHVWVLEEDSPLLGSLRVPLLLYAGRATDLIAVLMPHAMINASLPLWSNAAFQASLPGTPVHKWEHVERYSLSLLRTIDGWLDQGAAAFGEIFASTVCARTAGCSCADLRDDGFVQRNGYLFAWSHPLPRKEIRRLFKLSGDRGSAGRGMNRWLHAVQGSCDVLATARCLSQENDGLPCTLGNTPGDGVWIKELHALHALT